MKTKSPPRREIERIANVSLSEQARRAILEAIIDGSFDSRLPSEDNLAEMLNVSRTTIRTALQSLEQEGVINRRRAIGTTVNAHIRPSTLALQRMIGFHWLLEEKGYDVKVDVSWSRGEPNHGFTTFFPELEGEDCLLTEKSYLADGNLAILICDAVPWRLLRNQDFDGDVPASIFEFSVSEWKQPVDHAVAEIIPFTKKTDSDSKLPVGIGQPITRLVEWHYGSDSQRLAASIVDTSSDYFRFEVFRRA